jgi:hypothetical protein
MPKFFNEINQPCLNVSQFQCGLDVSLSGLKDPSVYLDKLKTQYPLECDSINFQAQVTSLEYPSLKDYNFFINDQTAVNLVKSQYDSNAVDVYRDAFLYEIALKTDIYAVRLALTALFSF